MTAGLEPGNFVLTYTVSTTINDYNVILLEDDVAMEYDCNAASDNYCVHFLSRTTTIDQAKLDTMIAYAGNTPILCLYSIHFSFHKRTICDEP